MNTDFRVSVDFFLHHKTKKLQRRLGSDGIVALLNLWAYASKMRPTGSFSGMSIEDIEIAANWMGEEEALVSTLESVGFLDKDGEEYRLHDWIENNSWVADSDIRNDKARFSRLSQLLKVEYKTLSEAGISSISKNDYEALRAATPNERQAIVKRLIGESPAVASETPNGSPTSSRQNASGQPAPAPAPSPAYAVKSINPPTPQGGTAGTTATPQPTPSDGGKIANSQNSQTQAQTQTGKQDHAGKKSDAGQDGLAPFSRDEAAIKARAAREKSRADFETFWTAYPKKVAKTKTWEKWEALRGKGDLPDVGKILAGLEAAKKTPQWQENHGQYIPNPSTWLNQGRWDDDFSELEKLTGMPEQSQPLSWQKLREKEREEEYREQFVGGI